MKICNLPGIFMVNILIIICAQRTFKINEIVDTGNIYGGIILLPASTCVFTIGRAIKDPISWLCGK